MANPDLKVSYDWLQQTGSNLKAIKSELDNINENQDGLAGDLGSGDMAHAMDDFCNNWGYHRRKLTDQVSNVAEMAEKTMEAFQDADSKLAKSSSGGKGGHK